jgi:hypothetical protein
LHEIGTNQGKGDFVLDKHVYCWCEMKIPLLKFQRKPFYENGFVFSLFSTAWVTNGKTRRRRRRRMKTEEEKASTEKQRKKEG